MTMHVRITNESTGTGYEALVRVYDVPPEGGNIIPKPDNSATCTLKVGESTRVMLHAHRFVQIDEVPPPKAQD